MPTVVHDFMPEPDLARDVRTVRSALAVAFGGASQYGPATFAACILGHAANGGILSAHEPEDAAAEYARQECADFEMLDADTGTGEVLAALRLQGAE